MYEFGSIVLVPFPFTDLSSEKLRPAVIISSDSLKQDDIIVCFMTSKINRKAPNRMTLEKNKSTGLKTQSDVRFDKIATLSKKIILGELGKVDAELLNKNKRKFFGVFGFR
ncbi:type II toxin-antitoxin system PemK/MazF family toxin [Patescibacteria group bacterium]|nr:type II toxin-antitoxin system PemK/MazF family toxin [Patescibacteria group bacterium]MBU1911387.1 type II toxin-antitoxin system PemK/MazF family toxin [Patescibacteria group bacterium]